MRMPLVLVGMDVLVHEGGELLAQLLDLRGVVEVHAALLRIFSACCQPRSASGTVLLAASVACWLAAGAAGPPLAVALPEGGEADRVYPGGKGPPPGAD